MKLLPKEALDRFDSKRIVHTVMNYRNFCFELEDFYYRPQLAGNGQVLPMVGDFIFVRPEQLLIEIILMKL